MRILYVVHQFYPSFVSGTEQYVLTLAREGRRRGDDVRVFTVDPDSRNTDPPAELRRYDYAGVPVTLYRFDKQAIRNHVLRDYFNPAVGPEFERCLDEFRPAVVHFFHLRWVGVDRLQEARSRGIPYLIHLMDFWYVCPNFLLLRPDHAQCDGPFDEGLSCFDCVHTWAGQARDPKVRAANSERISERVAPVDELGAEAAGHAMMARAGILREAFESADRVIAPSLTVRDVIAGAGTRSARTLWKPYSIDWTPLRDLGPGGGPITIGFMGTFAPHKGVDVLLRAFRRLEPHGESATNREPGELRLRLHGRFGDYPEFDVALQEIATGDPRIEFQGSFRREQLGEVLRDLHVLVVPSRWRENTPFVCLEARAAGIAVVASDLPGMTEAIPEGRGRTFRIGDDADLARVLREVIAEVRSRDGRRLPADTTIPTTQDQYADFRAIYEELEGQRFLVARTAPVKPGCEAAPLATTLGPDAPLLGEIAALRQQGIVDRARLAESVENASKARGDLERVDRQCRELLADLAAMRARIAAAVDQLEALQRAQQSNIGELEEVRAHRDALQREVAALESRGWWRKLLGL